ncbi:MAG: UDP-N-acetylmuramate dehydrogenase [Pseudohongiellaceae bacterium]
MAFEIQQQLDLKTYNSFGVSQRAAYFAAIEGAADLHKAREFAGAKRLPILVLGQGSNTLFIKDYPGLVLFMNNHGREVLPGAGMLRAAAAESWHELVKFCLQNSLYGIENLALIPGTVGAAPIQNIGAYGVELEQFFVELEAFDLKTGEIRHMSKSDCEFSYRDSLFKQDPGQKLVVLSVTLQLSQTPAPELSYAGLKEALAGQEATPQKVFDAVCKIRQSKLPDPAQIGNAGSFFKNPLISRSKLLKLRESYPKLPAWDTPDADLVKVPAAWLLEQKGWKGKRRGGAAVHEDHALVLVNRDGASGEDILLLAQDMSSSILHSFGIALQTEVRIV